MNYFADNDYLTIIDAKQDELFHLSDRIWDNPETAYSEHMAAELQIAFLKKQGFSVKQNLANIPTAFSAEFGKGGPVIGITGEYDALENLSQKADADRPDPIEKFGNGHGCGHNLLGVGSIAAAMAVKYFLENSDCPGTVVYFGCPAEEGGAGKAFMAREGVFQSCDVILSWHPGVFNNIFTGRFLANSMIHYKYNGISAHAAVNPDHGRSALDAVELMNVAANFLREHIHKDARLHYAITNAGGASPNVVPSCAEVVYLVRAPEMEQVHDICERINKIAHGAAMMTETSVEISLIKSCANVIPNSVLERQLYRSMTDVPLPQYSEEELAYAKKFTETVSADVTRKQALEAVAGKYGEHEREKILSYEKRAMNDFLLPYNEAAENEIIYGSTDVGDVSWQCPTAQISAAAWAPETPGHSWQVVAQGKSSLAHKSICYAGKVLSLTAVRMLREPQIITEAQKEHQKRLNGRKYIPIPEDVKPGRAKS